MKMSLNAIHERLFAKIFHINRICLFIKCYDLLSWWQTRNVHSFNRFNNKGFSLSLIHCEPHGAGTVYFDAHLVTSLLYKESIFSIVFTRYQDSRRSADPQCTDVDSTRRLFASLSFLLKILLLSFLGFLINFLMACH